jgi:hypothetical protein
MPKPEQLELIEVLPENVKKIRTAIRKRDEYHDEHIAFKKKADEKDDEIWELVQAAGGKLAADGTLSLKLADDEILSIKQSPARLSIKVKSPKAAKDDDGGDDDGEEVEGNEPALGSRSKK